MRRALWVIMVGLSVPGLASAQAEEGSWESLSQLRAGQKIEVVDMNLKSHKGSFLAVSEEVVSLRVNKNDVAIQRSEVLRVSVRGKRNRWASALVGFAIGAGAGAGISTASYSGKSERGFVRGVSALIGAGVGAGTGAAAPFIPGGSRTVYRAQKPGGAP